MLSQILFIDHTDSFISISDNTDIDIDDAAAVRGVALSKDIYPDSFRFTPELQ